MNICDECARERGRTSKAAWTLFFVGVAALILGVGLFAAAISTQYNDTAATIVSMSLVLLAVPGYFISVLAGCKLLIKMNSDMNSTGLAFMVLGMIFLPGVGLIFPLIFKKRIDRCTRADTALLPIAELRHREGEERLNDLQRRIRNGEELTSEQRVEYEQRTVKAQEIVREQKKEKAKSNFTWAIVGIVWTALLAVQGLGTYAEGNGCMTFLGIRLSPAVFFVIIAVFVVFDVLALVKAIKKRNQYK